MSHRIYVLITVIGILYLQPIAYSKEHVKQYPNPDYVEILLGNEDVPLFALGREILSSDDLQACSLTNIGPINTLQPIAALQQTEGQFIAQSRQSFENLLLGFPLKSLNKLMAMGAFLTDFSDNNHPSFRTPEAQDMIERYRLAHFSIKEVQPKITASFDNKGCVLSFFHCPERLNCPQQHIIFQASVLGVSVKHKALIIDPNDFGVHLENEIYSISPFATLPFPSTLRLNLENHKTHLIAFDASTLIFDVVAKFKWLDDPRPEVTTRWFLKFDLAKSEEGFQSRPPTKGIGYQSNILRYQQATSNIPMRILRQRIFKDGKIKPIRYYVKNVPSRFQAGVRRGFEYWRSLFVALLGHPILSYYFIQGDFDREQKIIAGDIRFNVLEWDFSKHIHKAMAKNISNRYTGEIWSSHIILFGAQLIDLYQEWFEYSQFVRSSMSSPSPRLTHPNSLLKSLFEESFQAPYRTIEDPIYKNILLPLFPAEETFNSYMSSFFENLTAHEIGHGLGLEHNHKANLFAKGVYAGNSQMDYFAVQDQHKPVSGEYDKMALAYGYLGVTPERTDLFCDWMDESPECKEEDQGSDPLKNAGIQLKDIIHLLTNRSHPRSLPYLRWNIEVQEYITQSLDIIVPFYYLANIYYDQLQTVLIDGHKPNSPQEVRDLVRNILSDIFCDPELNDILNLKEPYRHSNPYDRQLQRNVKFLFEWSYAFIQPYIKDSQCRDDNNL